MSTPVHENDYADDATNQPSCVSFCRSCSQPIEDDGPHEWNGWDWHGDCQPLHVIEGREQEARADERRDDR
jgi:hypothetical protein